MPKISRIRGISHAKKEFGGKRVMTSFIDANVCDEHGFTINLKFRRVKNFKCFSSNICTACACLDNRNITDNTRSPLRAIYNAMSHLQNGPKRNAGENFDVACKVMLLGDSGVGKTCVLVRFKDGAFLSGSFISTVGIDYKNKVVEVDGTKVKLQIWDTAGQERFRSITHAYYRDSQALLLLYDVTNETSFENIRAWLSEIYEYASSDVIIMLLGNKADLTKERVVTREQGEQLAKTHNVAFMETSARTGLNVDLAFMAVARDIKHRNLRKSAEPKFNIEKYVESQREKPGCCS